MHIWWRICSPSEWEGEIFRSDFNRHGGFFNEAKSPCKARALNTWADWRGAGRRRYKYCMGRAWREMLMKRMWTGSPALFPPTMKIPPPAPTNQHHHHYQAPSCYSTTSSALWLSFPWQPLAVLCCQLTPSLHTAAALSSVILLLLLSRIPCHAAARLHFSFYTCVTSGQPLHPLLLLLWCVVPLSHLPSMLCCIFHPLWPFFYLTKATVQV